MSTSIVGESMQKRGGGDFEWSNLKFKLAKSAAIVRIEPLGRIGEYNVVRVSFNASYTTSEDSEEVLRNIIRGLKALGVDFEYADLSGNFERAIIGALRVGLENTGRDVIMVQYRNYIDPLIVLVRVGREDLLLKVLETIIRLVDKALEPAIMLRKTIYKLVDKVSDIATKDISNEILTRIRSRLLTM